MKFFTIAFLLALIALCAVLFVLPDKIRTTVQTTSQEGYGVAATTYPIWFFTREVLDGTGIEVELLTPPDAGCPHDYVLTPNDLMKVSAARKPLLLFKNGAGLDDHICKAAMSANKGIVVIDTGAGIEVIGDDDHDDHDAEDDHDEEHDGEEDHDHEAEGHHHHHHGVQQRTGSGHDRKDLHGPVGPGGQPERRRTALRAGRILQRRGAVHVRHAFPGRFVEE